MLMKKTKKTGFTILKKIYGTKPLIDLIIEETAKIINAKNKILFGQIYPWNKGWNGDHCLNWSEVEERYL